MTDEERIQDVIALGHRLRSRIKTIVHELNALPREADQSGQALITWRVCLLMLIWDVSDAPLTLASTGRGQIRAIRMLNRSLFEYQLRLEYYAYSPHEAVKDWINAAVWFKMVAKGISGVDMTTWTKAERHEYNQIIQVAGEIGYPSVERMLTGVFRGRGCSKKERKKGVKDALHFYSIASAFIHGGPGAFYDLLERNTEVSPLHFRSYQLSEMAVTCECVVYLIKAISAESVHCKKDLGADCYLRDFDLITGGDVEGLMW